MQYNNSRTKSRSASYVKMTGRCVLLW